MNIYIQGGEGSFNEEATVDYCKKNKISDFEIHYAITTENVLQKISTDRTSLGVFAIYNNNSGIVEESVNSMSKYNVEFVGSFELPIIQCFHVKPGVTIEKIKRIISHPQALMQCSNYIGMYFKKAELVNGIDTAEEVKNLMSGKYDIDTAVIAPKICEGKYGSSVLVNGIQDSDGNKTCFCVVRKK